MRKFTGPNRSCPARIAAAWALVALLAPAARAAPPAGGAAPVEGVAGWTAAILARPLFTPGRRPDRLAAAPAASGAVAAPPRLSGILMEGGQRRAIFVPSGDGGHSLAVGEGGRVGDFLVTSIGLSAVVVSGPGGLQTLTPRFSNGVATNPALPKLAMPSFGVQAPGPKLGPERFEAPVGPLGLAMYRYSPAAPHAPPPVPDALVAP